jgi:DNA-binding beta-propeller fold protein YncE
MVELTPTPSASNWAFSHWAGSDGSAVVADKHKYKIIMDKHRTINAVFVQRYEAPGTFVRSWGGSGFGDGQFSVAYGIAIDSGGYVYVMDYASHRVQKFDHNGTFVTKWGSLGSSAGQFWYPTGIAVDSTGNVYVADALNNRIQKFSSNGAFIKAWGSEGSGDGQLHSPYGITVDGSGNVYVADTSNNRIQKFSNDGAFITNQNNLRTKLVEGGARSFDDLVGRIVAAETVQQDFHEKSSLSARSENAV